MLVLSALALVSGVAQAGVPIAPPPAPTVVAAVTSEGGFAPPTAPVSWGVQILSDGQVLSFQTFRDGHSTSKKIATLETDRVTALLGETKDLPAQNLQSSDPSQPRCADAPGTTYTAVNGHGVTVNLSGRFDCVDFVRPDGLVTDIPSILESLARLGEL
jgi:hypothetical protein